MAADNDAVLPSKRVRRAPGALTEEEKSRIEAERQEIIAAEMAAIVEMAKNDSDGEDAMDNFGDDFEDGSTESEEEEGEHDSVIRWTCVNCTFRNFAWQDGCMVCGEPRQSAILTRGHLAPLPLTHASNGTLPPGSQRRGSTGVGYDARMLLHQEVHTPQHIADVEATAGTSSYKFGSDTYTNQHSAVAARLAAGVSADMARAIMRGEMKNGIALIRPPGHHAESERVMGFCLHNNAAVAAMAAKEEGAKRVLIVDWDVHHGNGTQEIFDKDPSVLYMSLHRHEGGRFYPGTGAPSEIGSGGGIGFCVNVGWPDGGMGDADYLTAFLHIILPIAHSFQPDLTIVSAGFDAARGDPLGGCDRAGKFAYNEGWLWQVTPAGYAHLTSLLMPLSGGKLLVVLEGGEPDPSQDLEIRRASLVDKQRKKERVRDLAESLYAKTRI